MTALGVDLVTALTIDNVRQSDVGRLLDAIREAGFVVEVNVSRTTQDITDSPVSP